MSEDLIAASESFEQRPDLTGAHALRREVMNEEKNYVEVKR
jgi:hypothetical protein